MSGDGDDFRIRPGKVRDGGSSNVRRSGKLAVQVKRASMRAGALRRGRGMRKGGTGTIGRGRRAALSARLHATNRRVIVKARVVRQSGMRYRAAPLARHIGYLQRDGVTRDGRDAAMFDSGSDEADIDGFAQRCDDDRHHFRFIVSPEDGGDMADLRSFTRELMDDVARDLDTRLDWIAIDHWNTDNPHIHILVRGVADDGRDLVIDRDYIRTGMRARAEERVTLELGQRSELDMANSLSREVEAERWTSLDRSLVEIGDRNGGIIDLRPSGTGVETPTRNLLIGRATKLQRLGLAEPEGPARWMLKADLEPVLRDLGIRGDIIKTMHRAMAGTGRSPDLSGFALHAEDATDPVIGKLVERGLHDELQGTAYAVIDGADGRTHHLRFADIDMTGDARPGAIVELRNWTDARGAQRLSLATRSDLALAAQVGARGATWLDRQLIARDPVATGAGFGSDIRAAMAARTEHLVAEGFASRRGQRVIFSDRLIETLRERELTNARSAIAARTGLASEPSVGGTSVSGTYRERVTLASGRFAVIDNGLGFQLVPWRPALEHHLGQHVSGSISRGGGIDWNLARTRGIGL
ncbi:MAG: hypothetical protein JWR80_2918 [Bradyrhizobium sp.]|nr:hypothetical protein [Bradyrhizobium sp.]